MGQKINPHGFRLGVISTWGSRWFASGKHYEKLLLEDIGLRKLLGKRLKSSGLAQLEIERSINKIKLTMHVSRPGVVIGRGGSGLEDLKKYIQTYLMKNADSVSRAETAKTKIELAVDPVKEPYLSAHLVATMIADQLAKRLPHKRVCNQAIERVMTAGAKGVRIVLSGRIAGAEIARREKYQSGTIPLSTIRENVDFAAIPSLTKSGYIGVKVWICK